MPRLRGVNVEGLSVEGLTELLTSKYKEYVKDPQIYIQVNTSVYIPHGSNLMKIDML